MTRFTDQIPNVVHQYASQVARLFQENLITPLHVLIALAVRQTDTCPKHSACSLFQSDFLTAVLEKLPGQLADFDDLSFITEENTAPLPFDNSAFPANELLNILRKADEGNDSALEESIAVALRLSGDNQVDEFFADLERTFINISDVWLGTESSRRTTCLDRGVWLATCLSDLGFATSEMNLIAKRLNDVNTAPGTDGNVDKNDQLMRGITGLLNALSVNGIKISEDAEPAKICLLTALALGLAFHCEFDSHALDPTVPRFHASKAGRNAIPLLKELFQIN